MSKKNNPGKPKSQSPQQAKQQASSSPARKNSKTPETPVKKPMLNWLLLLVAVLPFFFSWETMDPILTVRYGLLSGFVLLFLLYFYGFRKKLISGGWPLPVRIIFILGVAYGIWNMIGLFTAVNPQQVYYGVARHFLNMLLLFIVTQIAVWEEKSLLRLCNLLTIAAILHSIVGICQFYNLAFNDLPGRYAPYGLMANRNLFGSAQVLLLPFAVFVLYKGARLWKYFAVAALAGIVASAILSQTRASWLSAIAFITVSAVLVAIVSPVNRKKWIIGTAAGIAAIAGITFLLIAADPTGEFSKSVKERTGTFLPTDTVSLRSGAAGNINERIMIWKKTMEVIKDNPLLGVGAGNWKLVVAKYGSEGLIWAKGEFIPDSPHNEYLLVAAESGIPGALLYFGMWVMIVVLAFKTIIKPQTEERRILNILMLAGLVAFAVDSMFSFPAERLEHSLYLFLMAGIVTGTFLNNITENKQAGSTSPAAGNPTRMKKWLLTLCCIVAAFNLFLGLKKYSFEKYLMLSKGFEALRAYQQSIDAGNKGRSAFVNIPPNGFPIETYIALSYKGLKNYSQAFKEMDKAIKHHPYNKALYINKGTIYTDIGKFDSAIQSHKHALKLTPEFNIIYFNLASNYYQLKNYKAVLEMLSKVDITAHPQLQTMKQQSEYQLSLQNQSGNTPVSQ